MKSPFSPRNVTLALALAASFSLTTFSAAAQQEATPAATAPAAAHSLIQRELAYGLYEMAYAADGKSVYVASADKFKGVSGGAIYQLDATTLETTGKIYTDLKNFGMAINTDGSALYTTNTLDGGVTKFDLSTGKVATRTLFSERNEKGLPYGAREIFLHDGELYIGGVADPGVIWVLDAKSMKLITRIDNAGKWVTGMLYSSKTDRLYVANGSGEILAINPHTHQIEKRLTAGDDKTYLFLNLAEDPATGRLFVTDNSKAKTTLVFDLGSGKVIKRIDGDALGIKFDAAHNSLYISQRLSKKVLQLDATTYAVKNSWSFDAAPNSLLLSPEGKTLYVTVKQGVNKDRSSKGPDSVARISLN